MDKKRIYALLIAATILTVTTTPLALPLPPPTPTLQQAQLAPTKSCTSPPQTAWNKTYGGADTDEAYSVQQTKDGGYILAGRTLSSGAGDYDVWLVKTDGSGTYQWSKTYGGTAADGANSVQQTNDGGYIVAGYTRSSGAGYSDCWVLKTDSYGNQQWNKTYGGTQFDAGWSIRQAKAGGYIVAGYTGSSGAGSDDFWLLKIDSAGNQQWSKTYGGTKSDVAYSVEQTSDGGYILAGYTISFGAGDWDCWLVKTNSAGNQQWNKTYGRTGRESAASVQQTYDGGYILAGLTSSYGAGDWDCWLVKTNSAGNQQWNKTYGGTQSDSARSIRQTPDGGYIVAVYTGSFGAGDSDFWLVKTDGNGNHKWNKTYGGTYFDDPQSVEQTSDGGYILVGSTCSLGAGGYDFWLVKTQDATPPCPVTDLAVSSPTSDSLTLTWTAPGDEWNRSTAYRYVVKYSTVSQISESNWDSAATLPQSWTPKANGTTETYTISGLSSNTRYWFAIKAYDEASNYGSVSNSPSGTTLAAGAGGLSRELLIVAALVVVAVVAVLALVLRKKR